MNTVSLAVRIKCTLVLLVLMAIDIGPVPVTAMIGLYIVLVRPAWFKTMVASIYGK